MLVVAHTFTHSLTLPNTDVNLDGYVTAEDVNVILQAVSSFPTNVRCGGIWATDFSCGSTRSAPETESYGIAYDVIEYLASDGLHHSARRQSVEAMEARLHQNVTATINDMLFRSAGAAPASHEALHAQIDIKLESRDAQLAAQLTAQLTAQQQAREAQLKADFTAQLRQLQGSLQGQSSSTTTTTTIAAVPLWLLGVAAVAVVAVVIAAVAMVAARRGTAQLR